MPPRSKSFGLFVNLLVASIFLLPATTSAVFQSPSFVAKTSAAAMPSTSTGPTSTSHAGDSKIEKVVLVGGTHGNEYTGVWVIKAFEAKRQAWTEPKYPSLSIETLLGNPAAHLANRRCIDTDLNREFSAAKLLEGGHDSSETTTTVESLRAKEIDEMLGPKFPKKKNVDEDDDDDKTPSATDLVIDLHTTTCNMGITLIFAEGDAIMAQAAAYICHEINSKYTKNSGDDAKTTTKCRCLLHTIPSKAKRPNLSSISKHGLTIEVGPVPQGVLRHDAVEDTELAMHLALEFLQLRHDDPEQLLEKLKNQYSDDSSSGKSQDHLVPCFRSVQPSSDSKGGKKAAQQTMSGKISWPTDPENPNFPAVLVHKSLQDRDFDIILKKGDPLFVTLDGSTIAYDGSHGDAVHLIFVNEGGYYYSSSGTGIGVALPAHFDLQTGKLV